MPQRGTRLHCIRYMGIALALVMLGLSTPAQTAAPDYWPTTGWRTTTPEQQGMDSKRLADMMASVQEEMHHIDSITLVRNGYLVLDAYRYPF